MIKVFVIDKKFKLMNPVHPAVARILLNERKAIVHRSQPFSIRLKVASRVVAAPLQLKLDPGSITTGIALVNHQNGEVVWGAELTHHGKLIKKKLEKRAAQRRSRRNRKTRYRQARFLNRTRPKGWLPPSLMHRVYNIMTWVNKLVRISQVSGISLELVKFDTQKMINPEISGVEYQQGELAGYEVREYLLEKYNRTCVYCGAKNIPLQIEHVIPRARGGSNRVSNLVIACNDCNKDKGSKLLEEYLKNKPTLIKKIKSQLKQPLKDTAAVNVTRWELWRRLKELELPIECGSGAMTKFNRTQQNLSKEHWIDAACVGKSTPKLYLSNITPLFIKSYGRGSRQIWQIDAYGFPKRPRTKEKTKFGFRTGDIAVAVVLKGKNRGVHVGRVITRQSPNFKIGDVDGINPKYIKVLQRNDGYEYSYVKISKDGAKN